MRRVKCISISEIARIRINFCRSSQVIEDSYFSMRFCAFCCNIVYNIRKIVPGSC
jgi:hypothetical protein